MDGSLFIAMIWYFYKRQIYQIGNLVIRLGVDKMNESNALIAANSCFNRKINNED